MTLIVYITQIQLILPARLSRLSNTWLSRLKCFGLLVKKKKKQGSSEEGQKKIFKGFLENTSPFFFFLGRRPKK